MSILHIVTTVLIGFFTGVIADVLTLQRVPGGLWGFIGVGIAGAVGADIVFRFLVTQHVLDTLFYSRWPIVLEQLIGSALAVGFFNMIKWDYR